jgi:hypothetical protein
MKLTLRSVIASALMAASTGSAWADQAVLILRGASMQFETQQPINASTANRGGDVPLRLIRPLVIDGTVVLPPGFESHGVVVRKPEAIGCNWLQVQWSIDKMRMPNGSTALVQKMFVPPSGVIPDRYDEHYLRPRGLKRIGRDVAELPADLFITAVAIFLPQQNAAACAGPRPDMTFPAHSLVPVAFAKNYWYRP